MGRNKMPMGMGRVNADEFSFRMRCMRFVWLSILCGVQVACLMTVTGWRALLFGATVLLTQYLNSRRDYSLDTIFEFGKGLFEFAGQILHTWELDIRKYN